MTPEELSKLADDYAMTRENRLAMQKKVDAVEEREKALKKKLIDELRERNIAAIGGDYAIVTYKSSYEPTLEDADKLYAHIRATGEFDLLYRRVNATAVKERKDVGVDVPGISWFPVEKLSVSKVPHKGVTT